MNRTYAKDGYVAGDTHYAVESRSGRVASRIVYYQHGAGNPSYSLATVEPASLTKVVENTGLPVICGDMSAALGGISHWGNDGAVGKFSALRSFAQALWPTAETDKPLGWGTSMGGLLNLNIEYATPGTLACLVMANPVLDPQDVYDNNRWGYAASISTAHGGRPNNAHTPARHPEAYANLPMLIFQSQDDPVCIPSIATTFAAASGAELVSIGSTGHQITNIDGQRVADFLGSYA